MGLIWDNMGLTWFYMLLWGVPARHGATPLARWLLHFMQNPTKVDENWGYPYFRKPPYI